MLSFYFYYIYWICSFGIKKPLYLYKQNSVGRLQNYKVVFVFTYFNLLKVQKVKIWFGFFQGFENAFLENLITVFKFLYMNFTVYSF